MGTILLMTKNPEDYYQLALIASVLFICMLAIWLDSILSKPRAPGTLETVAAILLGLLALVWGYSCYRLSKRK